MTVSNVVTAELNVNYYKEGLITISENYEKLNKQIKVEILKLNCIEDQQHLLQLQSKYIQEFKERAEEVSNAVNKYEKSLKTGEREEIANQIEASSRELIALFKLQKSIFEDKIKAIYKSENNKINTFIQSK
jgi:hypothetical protein